jgi:hypothetical protein
MEEKTRPEAPKLVRCEVLAAAKMSVLLFRIVMPCGLLGRY